MLRVIPTDPQSCSVKFVVSATRKYTFDESRKPRTSFLLLCRSAASQSFSTTGKSEARKLWSLQIQVKSVSWHPVELKLVSAADSYVWHVSRDSKLSPW